MPILGMNTHAKGKSASVAAAEGVFENFINEQCHIDAVNLSGIPSNILKSVNEVAHEHPMFSYAALVGSSEKHTDVSAYSDMDIKVHTRPGNIVTQRVRTKFIQEAKRRLELNKVTCFGYARKDAAVSFDCGCIEFDLVFTLPGLWCSEEKRKQLNTPNDDGVGDGFYNKPHLQRVVRALKLLIKLVSEFCSLTILTLIVSKTLS